MSKKNDNLGTPCTYAMKSSFRISNALFFMKHIFGGPWSSSRESQTRTCAPVYRIVHPKAECVLFLVVGAVGYSAEFTTERGRRLAPSRKRAVRAFKLIFMLSLSPSYCRAEGIRFYVMGYSDDDQALAEQVSLYSGPSTP